MFRNRSDGYLKERGALPPGSGCVWMGRFATDEGALRWERLAFLKGRHELSLGPSLTEAVARCRQRGLQGHPTRQ